MLQKDLIEQPQIWHLMLEITDTGIEAVMYSPYENHSLIYRRIDLDKDAPTRLKAIEDAVYDNPLLLSDFKRVHVLYDTPRYTAIPSETLQLATQLLRKVYPERASEPGTVLTSDITDIGTAIAFEIPDDTLGFLRRTFQHLTIVHPLAPQAAWLRAKYPAHRSGKTLINLRKGRIDIVIIGEHTPLTINSFRTTEPMDMLYYTMAARRINSLDADDEIFIAGDRQLRSEVSGLLHDYVRFVMPAIFPSVMFRAGKASLEAPFEMILTPVTADSINCSD